MSFWSCPARASEVWLLLLFKEVISFFSAEIWRGSWDQTVPSKVTHTTTTHDLDKPNNGTDKGTISSLQVSWSPSLPQDSSPHTTHNAQRSTPRLFTTHYTQCTTAYLRLFTTHYTQCTTAYLRLFTTHYTQCTTAYLRLFTTHYTQCTTAYLETFHHTLHTMRNGWFCRNCPIQWVGEVHWELDNPSPNEQSTRGRITGIVR